MNVLFIDHECHLKTRSADFFKTILTEAFHVTERYYGVAYRTGAENLMRDQDLALIYEFPLARRRFFFANRRNVFVPMYDNEWASFWQWKRIAWSGMGVISFCEKVSAHARRCGVGNLLDVRYFPDPASLPQRQGDPKRVFLWERGEITRAVAERLFPPSAGYVFVVKGANDFWPREQYLDRLASCGIVVAPRRKEGIGMVFLEAMAMGKCVAAYNDATMNEYITDGESGLLFDGTNPAPADPARVEVILANMKAVAERHYSRWQDDATKINAFIAHQPPCRPSLAARLKLGAAYPLYLLEGAFERLGGTGS